VQYMNEDHVMEQHAKLLTGEKRVWSYIIGTSLRNSHTVSVYINLTPPSHFILLYNTSPHIRNKTQKTRL